MNFGLTVVFFSDFKDITHLSLGCMFSVEESVVIPLYIFCMRFYIWDIMYINQYVFFGFSSFNMICIDVSVFVILLFQLFISLVLFVSMVLYISLNWRVLEAYLLKYLFFTILSFVFYGNSNYTNFRSFHIVSQFLDTPFLCVCVCVWVFLFA